LQLHRSAVSQLREALHRAQETLSEREAGHVATLRGLVNPQGPEVVSLIAAAVTEERSRHTGALAAVTSQLEKAQRCDGLSPVFARIFNHFFFYTIPSPSLLVTRPISKEQTSVLSKSATRLVLPRIPVHLH
jgi:hypothetical protein